MYEPKEDSFLLQKQLKNHVKPDFLVLDIGTGSGILALEAAKYGARVIAADIDAKAIEELKKNIKDEKIQFIHSDLFSNINLDKTGEKFDLIMFNPPYLPSEGIEYLDLDGGANGTEVIANFLKHAKRYVKKEGKILLLCSSLNEGIEKIFKTFCYDFKKIDEEGSFFEKLFVYELK